MEAIHKQQTDSGLHRQSNLELLRIIAMVMIVFHHIGIHSDFQLSRTTISIPRFWIDFIAMGGKIGVNIFVLISGYFLIQSTSARAGVRKLLKLWGQVFFYSAVFYGIHIALGGNTSIAQLISTLFPLSKGLWWFASAYFVLYLVHPYLNHFLRRMDKRMYQRLLLLLLLLWCVIPTLLYTTFEGNYLCWFVTLYSLAGYLRLYGFNRLTPGLAALLAIGFAILTYCSSVVLTLLGTRWATLSMHNRYFYAVQSLPNLVISVCTFAAFANIHIKHSKWINVVSSATFGVYLIHDNCFVRPFLWNTVFHNATYQDSILLIPYSVAVAAAVYISCTLLDLLRQRILERPFMRLVDRNAGRLSALIDRVGDRISGLLFGN